jgi:hypothetical protein
VFADAGRGYRRCVPRPEAERWPEAASSRTLARAAAALRPQAPAAQLVCPAAVPAAGRIAGRHGGLRRQARVDQVRAGPEMQHPEVLSEAYPEPLLAAMTEEHQEAARLSAAGVLPLHSQAVSPAAESSHWAQEFGRVLAAIRVDAMASHRERPAGPEVHFRDVAAAADLAVREQAKVWPLPAVAAQPLEAWAAVVGQPSAVPVAAVARPSEPEAAVEEEQSSEVRVAVAAQPLEARAAVVGQPSAVPVTAVAQDVPQEAAEVRDERLAAEAALPSAEQRQAVLPSVAPLVAPQALSLLAGRLARQRTTLPPRGPEVMRFERSRSQSLRAGSIEFVSWRPVQI